MSESGGGGNSPFPDKVDGLVELGTNVGRLVPLSEGGKAVGRLVVLGSKDGGSTGVGRSMRQSHLNPSRV
jgi:hypothetical protein